MVISAIILTITLVVFALGKSPIFRVDRAGIAFIGGATIVATGILTFDQAVQTVDYRTILLLFSMMILTSYLKASGFFTLMGNYMMSRFKSGPGLLFGVIMVSGLLSAFFINDIVCLLFTPIVILICKKSGLPPVPFLIAAATASNIGSAGTLLGNPQNILIGSVAKLPFLTYFVSAFPLALAGLFINFWMIRWFYRKQLNFTIKVDKPLRGKYHSYLIGKSLAVTGLILAGFLFSPEPVVIASLGAAYLLITRRLKPKKIYNGIDFNLLIIFCGLFVVIGGAEQSGLMNRIMKVFNPQSFSAFAILTVALSNLFSNVPAVMLLTSYIPAGESGLWWTGLGVFSTLAGNLTLTGSIANLIVVESAKRDGINISFFEYFKVGFPLTIVLVVIGLGYFSFIL